MPDGRAEVIAAWDEGPLLRAARLSALPAYRAGQAIKIYTESGGALFALATAHGRGRAPELLLRRGGGVANRLIASLAPGEKFDYDGPIGPGFPLEHARGRDVLLVAAGSAISAIRAVIETIIDERAAYGRVSLFYGQEQKGDFAYADARAAWISAGIDVTLCAHAPDESWTGARGFVQDAIIGGELQIDPRGAVAYLCGMPGMVSGVREALAPLGLPYDRTFLNY